MGQASVHLPYRRQIVLGGAILLASLGLAACQSSANTDSSTPSTPSTAEALTGVVALSTKLDHIHGAVVDSADGTILTATHTGVRRISPSGAVTKVGVSDDDFMGFAVPRPDRWLASGHPGPTSTSPDPLGLVESTDQGATWKSVSRRGETDFHALAANGNTVVGFDGHTGLIRSTDGGKTWTNASATKVAALAYSGDRLLAVTARGLEVSTDNGTTLQPIAGSPEAALLSTAGATVWVVDRRGGTWLSTDAGVTWQARAKVTRDVAGLAAVDAARAYAITTSELIAVG